MYQRKSSLFSGDRPARLSKKFSINLPVRRRPIVHQVGQSPPSGCISVWVSGKRIPSESEPACWRDTRQGKGAITHRRPPIYLASSCLLLTALVSLQRGLNLGPGRCSHG